ncbi:MAG: hypothetical protein QOK19_1254 [Solirubrobacteraceae bacterium]|jgi:hypothetical protein|nr:hypothetical protein [Solirubrobacteraceae bacterium]
MLASALANDSTKGRVRAGESRRALVPLVDEVRVALNGLSQRD